MRLHTSIFLELCVPTCWSVDLTPPTEWDEAWQESLWNDDVYGFTLADLEKVIQQEFKVHVKPLFSKFEHGLKLTHKAIEPMVNYLKECDDELNGTKIIKSQKPGIILPPRKVNSGPAWNPHARGGKGERKK